MNIVSLFVCFVIAIVTIVIFFRIGNDDDLLITDNSMEAPNSVNSSNSNSDSDSESEPECNGTPEFWDIEEQEVNVDLQHHDNVKSDSTQFVALRILKWTLLFLLLWGSFYGISATYYLFMGNQQRLLICICTLISRIALLISDQYTVFGYSVLSVTMAFLDPITPINTLLKFKL